MSKSRSLSTIIINRFKQPAVNLVEVYILLRQLLNDSRCKRLWLNSVDLVQITLDSFNFHICLFSNSLLFLTKPLEVRVHSHQLASDAFELSLTSLLACLILLLQLQNLFLKMLQLVVARWSSRLANLARYFILRQLQLIILLVY